MTPVTNEPMEGVAFNVQDHTRRTGTIWTGKHGEMIRSDLHGADQMDGETSSGSRDRTVVDQGFTPEKKRMFHQRHFGRARPRGIDPLLVVSFPWMAQDIT